jgi:hypothetical protein
MAEQDTAVAHCTMGAVPSVMSGPLYALARRLGLVGGVFGGTLPFGLGLAGLLWGTLMLLAAADGTLGRILTLDVVAGHVRLLVVIPLLFAAEGLLEPHFGRFVAGLHRAGIVAAGASDALRQAGERFNRLAGSRLIEAALLVLAFAPVLIAFDGPTLGGTATLYQEADGTTRWVAGWYWFVCLPVFRFLPLRWAWRLALYYAFLWRVSRLQLRLVPIHPDRLAGLGYLIVMQGAFVLLVAAISVLVSASITEEIVRSGTRLAQYYGTMLFVVGVSFVLFALPLVMFMAPLRIAREAGLASYMAFASDYVNAFDDKWQRGEPGRQELLGSADIQSLADIGNAVRVVDEMRYSPVSLELLSRLGAWAVLPFLPLLLFELPIEEIAKQVLERLIGG